MEDVCLKRVILPGQKSIFGRVLGVSAFEYVPWMVFNYSSVFIGLACAMLGIGIVKISAEDAKERLATSQMDTVLIEETPEPVQA